MSLTPKGEEYARLLDNPNVQRYLSMLRSAEHSAQTPDAQRYSTRFGGEQIPDLSRYDPTFSRNFTETNGRVNKTSAQGAYQFTAPTWSDVQKLTGVSDFQPRSQDIGALALLARNGSLPLVMQGDFNGAIAKDGGTWASLPSSTAPQNKRSPDQIAQFLGTDPKGPKMGEFGSGHYQMNDGRTVAGLTPQMHQKLAQIHDSPYSDEHKKRMVDVVAKLPEPDLGSKDLFGSDLPSLLDKDLRALIDRA